jgi:hypothetical protein
MKVKVPYLQYEIIEKIYENKNVLKKNLKIEGFPENSLIIQNALNSLKQKRIIDSKNKRIDQLSSIRTNQENRIDQTKGNKNKDKVRKDIQSSDKEIQKLSLEIDALNERNIILSDSVNKYNIKALEMKSGSEVAAEVGPLKYISELLDLPMANVVNYIILLIIIVFDPLAIALILATSSVLQTEVENNTVKKNDKPKKVEIEKVDEVKVGETISEEQLDQAVDFIIENPEVFEESNMQIEAPIDEVIEVKPVNRNFSVDVPLPKTNNNIQRFK